MGTLLNDKERALFSSIALETFRLAGVDHCVLWKFSAYLSNGVSGVDCLYAEPAINTNPLHYKPFRVLAFYQEPTQNADAQAGGEDTILEGRIYFDVTDLRCKKVPQDIYNDWVSVGDIAQIFKMGKYWYFDLKNIQRTGWVTDSETFELYVCDMIRNTDFLPERLLEPGGD